MSAEFRKTDAQILFNIVQRANQRYLRESRVNQKSTFNILRVLSAYKDTSQQYSARKQHIYNWIIYITKHYNPQTLKQWVSAIQELTQMNTNSNRQSAHSYLTNAYNLNKTVNEFNQTQSYGEYDESTLQHKSHLQFNISRDYETRNKYKYQQCDNLYHMPISSKMHYISFEPDHQNKQNRNSINQSHNTSKNNAYKIQNLPTRTPGDQSFIHTLPMSYGSPVNSAITKITQNTKQIVQPAQLEDQTEEWLNMKARADIFHHINLQMKSFSALLANFQAFQSFQQIYKKSKKLQKSMFCTHFFSQFRIYNALKKSSRQLADISGKFYENKLMKKAFKIINVLYKLKIQNPNRKKIEIQLLKPLNFQFILSILFSFNEKDCEYENSIYPMKSIRNKSKHFLKIQDCQKMQMISEYFQCNLKSTKEQMSNLFVLYNKSRVASAFKALSKNVRTFRNQIQIIQKMCKKSVLKDLLKISSISASNKTKIMLMNIKKKKYFKQKCFQCLLELALSKKIYSKRYQYIYNSHKQKTIKNVITLWKKRKQQVAILKLGLQTRLKESMTKIKKVMRNNCLKIILNKYKQTLQKQQLEQIMLNKQIAKKVFQSLKIRVKQRKLHIQIRNKNKMLIKNQLFNQWRKFAKIGKILESRTKILKSNAFMLIKKQDDFIIKNIKIRKYLQLIYYEKGLKQLRICYNLDKQQQQDKTSKLENQLIKREFILFAKITNLDLIISKKNKQQQIFSQKINKLKDVRQLNQKQKFIKLLLDKKHENEVLHNKKSIIKNVMGQRRIFGMQKNREDSGIKQNNTYIRCHLTMKKQFLQSLQQIYKFNKYMIQIEKQINDSRKEYICKKINQWNIQYLIKVKAKEVFDIREQNKKKGIINSMIKNYQINKIKQGLAINKYNKKLAFKALLSLAKFIINTDTLIKQIKNVIISLRRIQIKE